MNNDCARTCWCIEQQHICRKDFSPWRNNKITEDISLNILRSLLFSFIFLSRISISIFFSQRERERQFISVLRYYRDIINTTRINNSLYLEESALEDIFKTSSLRQSIPNKKASRSNSCLIKADTRILIEAVGRVFHLSLSKRILPQCEILTISRLTRARSREFSTASLR